jgi:hypothetical protein
MMEECELLTNDQGSEPHTRPQQDADKIRKIRACLEKDCVDLWELRELSLTAGGLVKGKHN